MSPTSAERQAEVLVIGGGVVGAAAALALARQGRDVALVERLSLRTAQGSSAGSARIFTPAPFPDESYLELGLRALEGWRRIEADSGERLLWPTGALSRGVFAERALPALREAGLEADLVSDAEARERFGVSVAGDQPLLHQADAGIIRADRARAVLLEMARDAGAELREERVRSLVEQGDSVEVETSERRWRCSAAIVAAGAWSGELLAAAGIELPLTVSAQSVAYFALRDPKLRPVALMEFEGEEPFACWDPEHGLKAAFHSRGPAVGPEPAGGIPVRAEELEQVGAWVRARFPEAVAGSAGAETCLYTNTPDERFLFERRGRIVVGSACNGIGFQFAPASGERLAQLALEPAESLGHGVGA